MTWRLGLAACALGACVAPESGNPARRCDATDACELGELCYRGFCVGDGAEQTDPITSDEEDAGPALTERDAAPSFDAARELPDAGDATADASTTRDAAMTDAATMDATVRDAAVRDARVVRDASRRDAGRIRPDAGTKCFEVCSGPNPNNNQCKKCVQESFGESVEDLCGELDDDDDLALEAAADPFCVSLCLGAASKAPGCAPQQLCSGPKCGGMP